MAAAGLLKHMGDGADEADHGGEEKEDQRHGAPHHGFAGKARFVRGMRPRHAQGNDGEEQQRASENVKVARHDMA